MKEGKIYYKMIQEELGCEGCRYCDEEMLYRNPCCTYPYQVTIDDQGRCIERFEGGLDE